MADRIVELQEQLHNAEQRIIDLESELDSGNAELLGLGAGKVADTQGS